jgi:hypothetical protein
VSCKLALCAVYGLTFCFFGGFGWFSMGLWRIAHYLRTLLAVEGVAWPLKSLHASQPSSRSSLATLIMYGSRPAAYSAPRLSPVPAYGRRLLLYAAALSTPSTSSCECGRRSTAIAPTRPVRSSGAWCGQRSGIKEEPEGRGTAAEPSTPSARASTETGLASNANQQPLRLLQVLQRINIRHAAHISHY